MDFFRLDRLEPPVADLGPLGERMERATSEYQVSVDWQLNMEIVDEINALRARDKREEVARFIRVRLRSKKWNAVLMTLYLMEAIAKNCGLEMLRQLGDEATMETLKKVVRESHKNVRKPDAKQVNLKAKELIQAWGEEFLPLAKQHGLRNYVECYHGLKAEGHDFPLPQLDENRPPIFTPKALQTSEQRAMTAKEPSKSSKQQSETSISAVKASETTAKVPQSQSDIKSLPKEFHNLKYSIDMLRDATLQVNSADDLKHNDALKELYDTVRGGEPSVLQKIQELQNSPATMEPLLNLNDELHEVIEFYKLVCKHGPPQASAKSTTVTASRSKPKQTEESFSTSAPTSSNGGQDATDDILGIVGDTFNEPVNITPKAPERVGSKEGSASSSEKIRVNVPKKKQNSSKPAANRRSSGKTSSKPGLLRPPPEDTTGAPRNRASTGGSASTGAHPASETEGIDELNDIFGASTEITNSKPDYNPAAQNKQMGNQPPSGNAQEEQDYDPFGDLTTPSSTHQLQLGSEHYGAPMPANPQPGVDHGQPPQNMVNPAVVPGYTPYPHAPPRYAPPGAMGGQYPHTIPNYPPYPQWNQGYGTQIRQDQPTQQQHQGNRSTKKEDVDINPFDEF